VFAKALERIARAIVLAVALSLGAWVTLFLGYAAVFDLTTPGERQWTPLVALLSAATPLTAIVTVRRGHRRDDPDTTIKAAVAAGAVALILATAVAAVSIG